jgi:peptide deformylase
MLVAASLFRTIGREAWSGRDIVTVGDPMLRAGAQYVNDVSEVKQLCDKMITLLRELNGAGLAASQVGSQARVIVVEVRKTDLFPDRPTSPLYVMINPKILRNNEVIEDGWEGCFSIPGLMGMVHRCNSIQVDYLTSEGQKHTEAFDGYIARVIQHEIDHLDGTLFIDRMKSMRSLTTVQNFLRFNHKSRQPNR